MQRAVAHANFLMKLLQIYNLLMNKTSKWT